MVVHVLCRYQDVAQAYLAVFQLSFLGSKASRRHSTHTAGSSRAHTCLTRGLTGLHHVFPGTWAQVGLT